MRWQPQQPILSWEYVSDAIGTVRQTRGLTNVPPGTSKGESVDNLNKKMSEMRRREISQAVPDGENQWSDHPQTTLASPRMKKAG